MEFEKDIPAGVKYKVEQVDYSGDGYTTNPTSRLFDGSIVANQTQRADYVNNKDLPQATEGNLKVTNTVTGAGDSNKDFSYTVTFTNDTRVNPTYSYKKTDKDGVVSGIQTVTGGTVTFVLKHNESVEFEKDIPAGVKYKVEQVDYSGDGYTTNPASRLFDGSIVANQTQRADYVNTKTLAVVPGNLKITNTVTGSDGDPNKDFYYTVTFMNEPTPGTYNYTKSDGSTGTISSGQRITLKHGEYVEIKDIPSGVKYTVVEDDYTHDGYTTTFTNANGEIESNTTKQADFINHKETLPGVTTPTTLHIGKLITGSGANPNDVFRFEIEFGNANPFEEYDYEKNGVPAGKIKSGDTFELKGGESIKVRNVPEGTGYTVKEIDYLDYTPETTVITNTI